jgi:hypothetical protein
MEERGGEEAGPAGEGREVAAHRRSGRDAEEDTDSGVGSLVTRPDTDAGPEAGGEDGEEMEKAEKASAMGLQMEAAVQKKKKKICRHCGVQVSMELLLDDTP